MPDQDDFFAIVIYFFSLILVGGLSYYLIENKRPVDCCKPTGEQGPPGKDYTGHSEFIKPSIVGFYGIPSQDLSTSTIVRKIIQSGHSKGDYTFSDDGTFVMNEVGLLKIGINCVLLLSSYPTEQSFFITVSLLRNDGTVFYDITQRLFVTTQLISHQIYISGVQTIQLNKESFRISIVSNTKDVTLSVVTGNLSMLGFKNQN